jgi:molybdopterin-binding protein
MWILNFLPDWIFYAILGIGVVGLLITYLLRFIPIPALYVYRTPIQLVSIVLIAYGVYMAGAISNENEWKAKVAKLEKEFAESQVQTEKVNTEVITKYVTKREVVYQKAEEQIRYIDREIVKYNDICKLPSEVIKIHNEAAKAPK